MHVDVVWSNSGGPCIGTRVFGTASVRVVTFDVCWDPVLVLFQEGGAEICFSLSRTAVRSGPGPVEMGKECDLPASLVFRRNIPAQRKRGVRAGACALGWTKEKAHNDILRLLFFFYHVTCVVILRAEHRNIEKSKKIHENDVKKSK
jgi:hypothetical protein